MRTGVHRQPPAALDDLDRSIINRLQDGFPLVERPFKAVADELRCDEQQLIERIERLRAAGVLTRFGPFFDAEAMGGAFCLCAMTVLMPSQRSSTPIPK
jgi:DNA-binding Lrp family transcriptional regulator